MMRKLPISSAEKVPETEDDVLSDSRIDQIMVRPDGYYWQAPDGRQEFGPFETVESALADMEAFDDEDEAGPGETLQEAENEIGISDWIDPETGEPAEGQSRPRFGQD
jgi:hypothetical protein